jgi:apolipoprotein D and lipocalin family protein
MRAVSLGADRTNAIGALLVLAAILAILPIGGCTGAPEGVTPVTDFAIDRYLGTWYEIARLDHSFERGLTNVTATYEPREGGGIEVVNRGYDPESGAWREARGKAFFVDDTSTGMLKVSFFGPFYGGYNVIALDRETYGWSMVVGPSRAYLWILARSPDLDPGILDALIAEAKSLGFPVGELIRVPHAPIEVAPARRAERRAEPSRTSG